MKVTIYKDAIAMRTYICEAYEEIYEDGYWNLYITQEDKKTKVCTIGDFGSGYWGYDVESEDGI